MSYTVAVSGSVRWPLQCVCFERSVIWHLHQVRGEGERGSYRVVERRAPHWGLVRQVAVCISHVVAVNVCTAFCHESVLMLYLC